MAWQDTLFIYWWNNSNPGIAVSPIAIHGIGHATRTVTRVQIGDHTGILPAMCTGPSVGGTCVAGLQNCEWDRDHANEYNEALLFITCRPMTLGVSYVANNPQVGDAITWFSTVDRTWKVGAITLMVNQHTESFPDGSTAAVGTAICNGPNPVGGDSGSPVFLLNGDFFGSIDGAAVGGGIIVNWAYPTGSLFRPTGPPPVVAGLVSAGSIYGDDDED